MGDRVDLRRKRNVLIIGGGIAGLAAALRVRALDASYRITIVDAAPRLGGKIAGEIVAGCVVDGGADVCIGDKLRTTRMFADLDLATRIVRVNPNGLPTYEWRNGALERCPTGFAGELLTFRRGMQELVDAAWSALDDVTVVTKTSVQSLSCEGAEWRTGLSDDTTYVADAVVIATPAPTASALLSSIAPREASALLTLAYPATATVTMAWRAEDVHHKLDATGYLVADNSSHLSACTWTSSKNPSHASDGMVLLRGYVRAITDDAAELMRAEVATVLRITAPPVFTRRYDWPQGIPRYTPDHESNVRSLEIRLATVPGLFIAGSAFHGVGIPDCIISGEQAASHAVAYLASRKKEAAA